MAAERLIRQVWVEIRTHAHTAEDSRNHLPLVGAELSSLLLSETPGGPRGAEQRGLHRGREGVRLRVPPGPVADHHAAPHQEDHPGGRRGPEVD